MTKLEENSEKQTHFCARCSKPILDEYLTTVLNKWWHEKCLQCSDCGQPLSETCYARHGSIFCRDDFYRRFAPRCSGCDESFRPTDLVRKARDHYFHVSCFTCVMCHRQLHTGDQLFIIGGNLFVCKEDYLSGNYNGFNDYGEEDVEDEDCYEEEPSTDNSTTSSLGCYTSTSAVVPPANLLPDSNIIGKFEANNNSSTSDNNGLCDSAKENQDSEDEDKKKADELGPGGKRRGPRTTIKAKQLETLKTAFSQTPKPTRHIREQLAKETGLPMRVIQVWFQNKRSKERRMKQLCNRNKFYSMGPGGPKMRKFGSTSLDDPRFFFYEGRPEFQYPYPPQQQQGDFFPPPPPSGMAPFLGPPGAASQSSMEMLNMAPMLPGSNNENNGPQTEFSMPPQVPPEQDVLLGSPPSTKDAIDSLESREMSDPWPTIQGGGGSSES